MRPAWLAAHPGKTWRDAGTEARRRMERLGYETWAINEFMLPIASDPTVRRQMASFAQGLAAGKRPLLRGVLFHVAPFQRSSDVAAYKRQLEGWLTDSPFWRASRSTSA
jgi:hypothetical protein